MTGWLVGGGGEFGVVGDGRHWLASKRWQPGGSTGGQGASGTGRGEAGAGCFDGRASAALRGLLVKEVLAMRRVFVAVLLLVGVVGVVLGVGVRGLVAGGVGEGGEGSGGSGVAKVLILGDSVAMAYTPYVAKLLAGRAEVRCQVGNGGPTVRGLEYIDRWLGDTEWDVIHFNWGLWDMYGWQYPEMDRSPGAYERRLEVLTVRLKRTGAELVWATTTPACRGAEMNSGVVISAEREREYLDAAMRVMGRHGVRVNDLHTYTKEELGKYSMGEDNIHYTAMGQSKQGERVARVIAGCLAGGDEG